MIYVIELRAERLIPTTIISVDCLRPKEVVLLSQSSLVARTM